MKKTITVLITIITILTLVSSGSYAATIGIKDSGFEAKESLNPLLELSQVERSKISPVLLKQFLSKDVIEPIEALVNPLPSELTTPPVTKICLLITAPSWSLRWNPPGPNDLL